MRRPYLDDGDVQLYLGDCLDVLAEMDPESVAAVVCDPPYGLEFMGKDWDRYAPPQFAAWCETWAREALRVLKPGGHLLAFGGTRTFHRLTCGIEDAGFEIRDCLSWLYGSGFPKSLDVSKAIDKAAGAEREVVGYRETMGYPDGGTAYEANRKGGPGSVGFDRGAGGPPITAPATDAAREWEGWGTALKPGFEPCVVARKPLAGTVAENVQRYGTGALNIDGCRIGMSDEDRAVVDTRSGAGFGTNQCAHGGRDAGERFRSAPAGRWPANVALDEQAAAMLDAQSGEAAPKPERTGRMGGGKGALNMGRGGEGVGRWPADPGGGASRFYYTAKASRADRNTSGANNTHPTVKPTDLMRWLVRLVTPPGGVVLDPFAGSGSTLVAARAEGFRAIGIEREEEYAAIIADRLSQLSLFSEGAE